MADWTAKVSPRESYFITRQGSGDRAVMLEERWRTRYMTKSFWSVLHYYDDNSQRSWWCHDFSSEDRLFRCGRKDSRSTDRAILVATVVFERVPNLNFSLFALHSHFISHELLWLCHWLAKKEVLEDHLLWKTFESLWRSRGIKSRVCCSQFFGIQASLLLWHYARETKSARWLVEVFLIFFSFWL